MPGRFIPGWELPIITQASLVFKDPTGINSVLLSDFTTNPGVAFSNGQVQGGSPDGGGTLVVESNGVANDPKINFNTGFEGIGGGNLDLSLYPNMRSRHSSTGADANFNTWRIPAIGGQAFSLAGNDGGFAESQGTVPNPIVSSGYRVDPRGSGTGWTVEFDYIYADRGRTVGFEFGHDGDNAGITPNAQITGGAVAGGIFSGTVNDDDPMLTGSVNLDPSVYRYAELRLKVPANGARIDLFWANSNGGFSADRRVTIDESAGLDGNWHTYVIDFGGEAAWTGGGTVTNFRLDPTAGNAAIGGTFEVDYIRFQEVNVVPEPGTLGLLLAGFLILINRRRSFMRREG